jgi:hypothetical protein
MTSAIPFVFASVPMAIEQKGIVIQKTLFLFRTIGENRIVNIRRVIDIDDPIFRNNFETAEIYGLKAYADSS